MSDIYAIYHRVVLKPITVKPVIRPGFNNTHIGQERSWINDNSLTLARYFWELGGKKIAPTPGADLNMWTKVQYEIEVIHAARRAVAR